MFEIFAALVALLFVPTSSQQAASVPATPDNSTPPDSVPTADSGGFFAALSGFFTSLDSIFTPSGSTSIPDAGYLVSQSAGTAGSVDPLTIAKQQIISDEGQRADVYVDSQGVTTVGIGHKVVPSDGLSVGDVISQEQIDAFFNQDVQVAYQAAINQANDLGQSNPYFIASLVSVNFQLGSGWKSKFYNTYALIKQGSISNAISHLYQSAWYQQTPNRVDEFVTALNNYYGVA